MAARPAEKINPHSAEHLRKMCENRSRNARERRIAELITKAPALTAEQRARLSILLNSQPASETGKGAAA